MKFKVTDDKKFLVLIESTQLELEQLEHSFTKKPDNWFILKKKIPHWDGEIKFIDKYNRIPIGLWQEIKNISKNFHFPLKIEGIEHIIDNSFNEKDFIEWYKDFFKNSKYKLRDYQLESAKRVLKFRNCTQEIATAGGKTLIVYVIFRYLLDRNKSNKMLYVVPNVSLVNQTEEKFYEYEASCGKKPKWKSNCVFGGSESSNTENTNITFGTYQSLIKKDLDYFSKFDSLCIDETHHAKCTSIKNLTIKCYNAKYKFGLTGTLPKQNSCDSFTIQAHLGPKVYEIASWHLIEEGNATPVHVFGLELDYLKKETKKKLYELRKVPGEEKDGAKLLNLEKDMARENRKRFIYICETISKVTKNSLVLFADIKNNYGRDIYNWMRENTDKNVYYIDGGTKADNREYYKKQMENEKDVILIASVGTFSEGIDILNLHNIFITESHKSEYIIRQILGRGMRLMEGKETIKVIDFSDNYEYGSGWQKINYLMRHAKERENIYKEKKFPFKRFKIKL